MAPNHWLLSSYPLLIPQCATITTFAVILLSHWDIPAPLRVWITLLGFFSALAYACVLRRLYPLCRLGADDFRERMARHRALMGLLDKLDEVLELSAGAVKDLEDFAGDLTHFSGNFGSMLPVGNQRSLTQLSTQEIGRILERTKKVHAELKAAYNITEQAVFSPALAMPGPTPSATDDSPRHQEKEGTKCPGCHGRHHKDGM